MISRVISASTLRLGRSSRGIIAAAALALVAPRHGQPLRSLRRGLRRHLLPSLRLTDLNPTAPSTPSIAPWTRSPVGPQTRRLGAAGSTTWAARSPCRRLCCLQCSRRCLRLRPTPTIAPMVSRIGRWVGPSVRRSGAAEFMAKDAMTMVVDARQAPHRLRLFLTTAMLASPIGWRVGASRRRIGAVRTLARGAQLRTEAVPELGSLFPMVSCCRAGSVAPALVRAIFRRFFGGPCCAYATRHVCESVYVRRAHLIGGAR